MRNWVPFGVVALGGCAQIFGIDKTSLAPDGGSDDGPASILVVDRLSVGTTALVGSQPTADLMPAVFFDDAGIPIASTAIGSTWSADKPSASVEFFLPDFPESIPRSLALPTSRTKVLFGQLEHPNPQPQHANASFQLAVTLDTPVAAGETFQMFSVGAWSQVGLAPVAGDVMLADVIPGGSLGIINGRGLDAITPADTVTVLRYVGDQLTGYAVVPPFAEVDGVNTVTATMAPTGTELLLGLTFDNPGTTTRMATTVPANGAPSFSLNLNATPAGQFGQMAGIQLRAQGVDPTLTTLSLPFGDQLPWAPTLQYAATSSRAFTPAAGANAGLTANLFSQLLQIQDASAPGALSVTFPAGLPTAISIAGMPLAVDGAPIAFDPAMQQTVTFTADVASNTLYQAQVLELVPNATSTGLQFANRFSGTGVEPTITIPGGIFVSGHDYVVRAICISGGYPGLADGDLTKRELPVSLSLLDSAAFEVP